MSVRGVLFDMDGVIVDSEEFICEAAMWMFAEHGVETKSADFIPFVGAGENRYLGGVAEKYGFPIDLTRDKARTYEIYGEIIKGKLDPLPGVKEFVAKCKTRGLRLALATSADEIKMVQNLTEIGVPPETFDTLVNGLDIEHKKPDPEIFLVAASRLGLQPSECLVVEDAVNGVAAAKAAGARCLALTTSFSEEELAGADWFAPNLAGAPKACLEW
jgi:HAD superfamily hydrolase (TIGR01509 family)